MTFTQWLSNLFNPDKGIRYITKTTDGQFLDTLSYEEFGCHCDYTDCTRILYYQKTIDSYEDTRDEFGEKIKVSSGHRCQRHNWDEGGELRSYHMIGHAIDITPLDFSQEKLDNLEVIARKHFDVVIRYNGFIHCHNLGEDDAG